MTVKRYGHAHFDASPTIVARAVRAVLSRQPPYVRTYEIKRNAVFKTNVRPGWWLSGTDMTIELNQSAGGTMVTAETKSQFYILGDVFGFYDGYIQSFLADVRRTLRTGAPGGSDGQEEILRDEPTAA
jgi:hypothetical protein